MTVSAVTFDGLRLTVTMGTGALRNYARFESKPADNASQEIIAESELMNKRWAGWMYRISDVRRNTVELTMDDLVESTDSSWIQK